MTTKTSVNTFRNGLSALLRPEDSVLVLIDHQPYQLANLNSHDPHMAVNNAAGLAKAAKVFGIPTILTSVVEDRGGKIFPQITSVFPDQEVIDRTPWLSGSIYWTLREFECLASCGTAPCLQINEDHHENLTLEINLKATQNLAEVARGIGVQFFALVESEADRNLLAQNLAVDTAHILDSSRRSFVQSVVQATQGQGVDAIIADQQSPAMVWSADLLSDAGYFLDLSTSHSGNANFPSVQSLKRNASLIRINPQSLQGRRLATMKSLFKTVFTQPFAAIQPTTVVTVESLPQVVSTASSSAPMTLVLSLGPDAAILTMPTPVEQLQLDPNGTYVLAGGLGALGLNIANMMADRGAKHLVFLSRSGGSKNQEDRDRFQERAILA
jgi:hypothetical protein